MGSKEATAKIWGVLGDMAALRDPKFTGWKPSQQEAFNRWNDYDLQRMLLHFPTGEGKSMTALGLLRSRGYMEAVTKVGVMATGGSYVLNGLLSNEAEKVYELDLETSQELDKIVANLEFIVQFGSTSTKERVKELISKHKLEDIVNLEADGFGIIEGFKAVKGSVTHIHKLLKFINDAFLALEMGH